jgi:hypothetical protein
VAIPAQAVPIAEELVWVEKLTADLPVVHRVKNDFEYTICGKRMSFTMKHSVMPWKHATKFAGLCPKCW